MMMICVYSTQSKHAAEKRAVLHICGTVITSPTCTRSPWPDTLTHRTAQHSTVQTHNPPPTSHFKVFPACDNFKPWCTPVEHPLPHQLHQWRPLLCMQQQLVSHRVHHLHGLIAALALFIQSFAAVYVCRTITISMKHNQGDGDLVYSTARLVHALEHGRGSTCTHVVLVDEGVCLVALCIVRVITDVPGELRRGGGYERVCKGDSLGCTCVVRVHMCAFTCAHTHACNDGQQPSSLLHTTQLLNNTCCVYTAAHDRHVRGTPGRDQSVPRGHLRNHGGNRPA